MTRDLNEQGRYGTPGAFRRALTDKLRTSAKSSRWSLQQLQRLYIEDQGWIVKGATALLARDIGVRATIDIDVYRDVAADVAERDLRAAAARDIGDWFRFEIGAAHSVTDADAGVRVPVAAYVGATAWANFHVDLVGGDVRMTGEPDDVPPLARVAMAQLEQHGYRAYLLVDHIADKVAATFERYGQTGAPSTRYKDLVDILAIVIHAPIDAEAQARALASEAQRRQIALPDRFTVPDLGTVGAWLRGGGSTISAAGGPVSR